MQPHLFASSKFLSKVPSTSFAVVPRSPGSKNVNILNALDSRGREAPTTSYLKQWLFEKLGHAFCWSPISNSKLYTDNQMV
jgi:hypothetical protein